MVFPTKPTEVILNPGAQTQPYAMQNPPAAFRREISKYEQWCGAPVNTERSLRYIKAVQTTSLAKTEAMVLGYAGVCISRYGLERLDVNLGIYANPSYLAYFIGFLQVSRTM